MLSFGLYIILKVRYPKSVFGNQTDTILPTPHSTSCLRTVWQIFGMASQESWNMSKQPTRGDENLKDRLKSFLGFSRPTVPKNVHIRTQARDYVFTPELLKVNDTLRLGVQFPMYEPLLKWRKKGCDNTFVNKQSRFIRWQWSYVAWTADTNDNRWTSEALIEDVK